MTKKNRFIFHKGDGEVEDTFTTEFYKVDQYRFDTGLVNLLNRLSDENERLKFTLIQEQEISKELKSQINIMISIFEDSGLNEILNDSKNNRNNKEKNCGYCKNYNLDGMFGIWCSIHEIPTHDKYCQDFEWNR